jgi:hypothetical protein
MGDEFIMFSVKNTYTNTFLRGKIEKRVGLFMKRRFYMCGV